MSHASQPQLTLPIRFTTLQESIPILIVGNNSSQELTKTKNEILISVLFTDIAYSIIGSNIGSNTDRCDNNNSTKATTTVSNISGVTSAWGATYHVTTTQPSNTTVDNARGVQLTPLGSVNNKSIQMKWEK